MSNPNQSNIHANEQRAHWMKYNNKTFQAEYNVSSLILGSGYSYRNTHYTEQVEKNKTFFGLGKDEVFFDPEWDVRATENLDQIIQNNSQKIILRRLGHLYPTNEKLRPKFFPENDYNEPLKKVEDLATIPHFLHELGLFPTAYYKSLFFTQDFQASGLYHAVVNVDGRWETDVVDDFIPIYQKSGKPIWGMDLQQPWQLILLKFWAKRNYVNARQFYKGQMSTRGGYVGVKNAAPFEFVNTFSNANWKFINFASDFEKFLRNNVNIAHKGHMILKTKNSSNVRESGLIPNQACYELINLVEQGEARQTSSGIKNQQSKSPSKTATKKNYVATIRSSDKNSWTGKRSILDPQFKKNYLESVSQLKQTSKYVEQNTVNDKKAEQFGVDRCFTIQEHDLKNLFSCCYITPRRIGGDSYSNYFKFVYPANRKKAIYLEFQMPAEGFLDFSIKQPPSNRIEPSKKSKIEVEQHNQQHGDKNRSSKIQRFLRNKYILLKDNQNSDTYPLQEEFQRQYNRLHYQTYEIEYLKGYNSGDAHFLKAVKGRYILRIKSETLPRDAHYVVNYCCKHNITLKQFQPTPQQESRIMKDAMASIIDKVKRITLRPKDQAQIIAYGNTFEYVGYGFVGVKIKKTSKTQVLIDVDPKQLEQQGYRLKHQYKKQTAPFAVLVKPGEATSIVLKKIHQQEAHSWPPKGIGIFQK